jgi:hypothetical protein
MLADLSIHDVENIEIRPVRISDSRVDVHREIIFYTKKGEIAITLWGRCNPIDSDHTTLEITL